VLAACGEDALDVERLARYGCVNREPHERLEAAPAILVVSGSARGVQQFERDDLAGGKLSRSGQLLQQCVGGRAVSLLFEG